MSRGQLLGLLVGLVIAAAGSAIAYINAEAKVDAAGAAKERTHEDTGA